MNQPGDVTLVGNGIMTCRPGSTHSGGLTCTNALAGGAGRDNDFPMIPIDVDGDSSTFDSSTADFTLPSGASVTWAGLYWQCVTSGSTGSSGSGEVAAPNASARNQVLFKVPGGAYQSITASVLDTTTTAERPYQGFAEVTSLVSTSGTYSVANIQCDSGFENHYGGWTMVVAYRDETAPLRNITVFDAFQLYRTSNVDFTFNGFVTPPSGTVRTRVGIVFYDGDRGEGDTLQLRTTAGNTSLGEAPGSGVLNPNNDIGNGTVSAFGTNVTTRSPAYANTLGYDIDMFQVNDALPHSATSATVRARTSDERIALGVVAFATDIFAPTLTAFKTASVNDVDSNGTDAGDIITYTIIVTNEGDDSASATTFRDPIPEGTSFVAGSIRIAGVAKTDADDSDTAELEDNQIIARLGTGATSSVGGTIAVDASVTVSFQVRIDTTDGDEPIHNVAYLDYFGTTLGQDQSFTATSDGDSSTAGNQDTIVTTGSRCGDSRISGSETCDDGATVGGDGCSASCRREVIIDAPTGVIGERTPAITGRADANATVVVRLDGLVLGTVMANSSGQWTITPSSTLADGSHVVRANATDTLSGTSVDTNVFVIDTSTVVAVTSPIANARISDTTPIISGTGETGATVSVYVDSTLIGTTVVVGGVWSLEVTTPLSSGAHTARATAIDIFDNTAMSATVPFTIDTATSVAIVNPADSAVLMTSLPIFTGTGEVGATVEVRVDGSLLGTTVVPSSGTWTFNVTSPLSNGAHLLAVRSTDVAGNVATDSAPFSVLSNTFVSITTPAEGAVVADSTPTITGTGEVGGSVTVTVDGATVGAAVVGSTGSWIIVVPVALAEGPHSVTATIRDTDGNMAADSSNFVVDTGTYVEIVSPRPAATIGNVTPTISGESEPNNTVEITIDGTVVGTATTDAEGNWSLVLTTPLVEGPHNIAVTATDTSGNRANDTSSFLVDLDRPFVVIDQVADGATTSDATPTYRGVTTPGLIVTVLVDSVTLGSVMSDSHGLWSFAQPSSLSAGDHIVSAEVVDARGQRADDANTFTVDLSAPTLTISSPVAGSTTNNPLIPIAGAADPGATVQLFVDGVLVATLTADGLGAWTFTPTTPFVDGLRAVRAVTRNDDGGTATATSAFIVDTTTFVTITFPMDGSTIGALRPVFVGTGEVGATVAVSVDGTPIGTTVVGADGRWTLPAPTTLTETEHEVVATATDVQGNTATTDSTFTIDADTDRDTDGDGIPDSVECASGEPCPDTDGDTHPDYDDPDDDGDGLPTALECTDASDCENSDGDAKPDYLDSDDDNDGRPTSEEAPGGTPRDTDLDSKPDHLDPDDDGDGIPTATECTSAPCVDTDDDAKPDFLDPDDDDDTIPTSRERADGEIHGNDVDNDGKPNHLDVNSDGDSRSDQEEGVGDDDGDGIPNYLDPMDNTPSDAGVGDGGDNSDGGVSDADGGRKHRGEFLGGACSVDGAPASRGSAGWFALLLVAAAVLVRRRRSALGVMLAVFFSVSIASTASAQGFALDQFRAAETTEDGFAISSPSDLGHLRVSARLTFDYALNPLVYVDSADPSSNNTIVEHMLVGNIGVALGVWERMVVYVGLPATLYSSGENITGFPPADGSALGDLYLGVRGRIWGERNDLFALAAQATLTFPTAEAAKASQSFSGDDGFVFLPKIMGEFRLFERRMRIGLNLGARVRGDRDFENVTVQHELTYGMNVIGSVIPRWLDVTAEIYGSTPFNNFFDKASSSGELLVGARTRPYCGLDVGIALGAGLVPGYGTPDVRAVLQAGYVTNEACDEAPVAAAEPGDTDGDGILDSNDACPTEPEDKDNFEDENGCPDPDNDGDTIFDTDDQCPNEPEDRDQFEDENGCPDPDNDQDQILDGNDQCPNEPEDRDQFEDENGCPDPDNDRDTVPDTQDQCPIAPGRPEDHGCPRTVRVDTQSGAIIILERVEFATNRDVILERSFPILEEVRAVLVANPQLRKIRISGHTDDRGRDAANMDLSRRRAGSVRRWLTEHGVEASRLSAVGCGELHFIGENRSSEGRQSNRRVEFQITDPAPASVDNAYADCQEAQ